MRITAMSVSLSIIEDRKREREKEREGERNFRGRESMEINADDETCVMYNALKAHAYS